MLLLLSAYVVGKAGDARAAEKAFSEAFLTAEASRHDEVRAEAASAPRLRRRLSAGQFRRSEAVGQNRGGHPAALGWPRSPASVAANDLGGVLVQEGSPEAAMPLFERSLALKEKTLGPRHPDVGIAEDSLAFALYKARAQRRGADAQQASSFDPRAGAWSCASRSGDLSQQQRGDVERTPSLRRGPRSRSRRPTPIWQREFGADNCEPGIRAHGHRDELSLPKAKSERRAGASGASVSSPPAARTTNISICRNELRAGPRTLGIETKPGPSAHAGGGRPDRFTQRLSTRESGPRSTHWLRDHGAR